MVVTRVGALSCARIAGLLYAVLGLIVGCLLSVVTLVRGFGPAADGSDALAGIFGIASVMILPILYGFFGFVMTLIAASLYNVLAGVVGGVELDVQ